MIQIVTKYANEKEENAMKSQQMLMLVSAVSASLLLWACAPASQPTASATVTSAPTWTPMIPTDTPTPEPSATATTEPTEVVVLDYCVACHTDKDQLITTARVEAVVEKESEGVG